jgi:hypothetical protein
MALWIEARYCRFYNNQQLYIIAASAESKMFFCNNFHSDLFASSAVYFNKKNCWKSSQRILLLNVYTYSSRSQKKFTAITQCNRSNSLNNIYFFMPARNRRKNISENFFLLLATDTYFAIVPWEKFVHTTIIINAWFNRSNLCLHFYMSSSYHIAMLLLFISFYRNEFQVV